MSKSSSRGRSKSPLGTRKSTDDMPRRDEQMKRRHSPHRQPVDNSRLRRGMASSSRSRSPSSSLGGRFDPTAYALERAERLKKSKSSPGWGAAATSER
jgi:hypothetical protein